MTETPCDRNIMAPTNGFDCHKIIDVAEMFLEESYETVTAQRMTDILQQISSAKLVVFNLYDANGRDYRTEAVAGVPGAVAHAAEVLGFDVVGRRWVYDPAKADRIGDQSIACFPSLHDLTAARIPPERIMALERALELGAVHVATIRKDARMFGDFVMICGAGAPLQNDGLVRLFVKLVGLFITRKEAEEQVQKSHERFLLAVNGNRDGIWDWDILTGQLFLSVRWKEMLGYTDEEIVNRIESFRDLLHPEDRPRVLKYVDRYLKGEFRHYNIEFRMRHQDGSHRWILARGEALYDDAGKPVRMAGSHTDFTEKKDFEQKLENLASTDGLTGLWNRRHFFEAGNNEVARAKRYRTPFSVMMLDLDHFKRVNDTYGHGTGDAVILAMAEVLRKSLRDVDLPARIGGEEFAVLLPNTDAAGALVAAERIRAAVEALRLSVDGHRLSFTVSIGVAGCCLELSGLDEMLRQADAALYSAKEAGRNRCRSAHPAPPPISP